ncbi:MAG: preprotein translocase subunit SecA [Bacteroidota bacterium]
MFDFINKLFGDKNGRQLKQYWPMVEEINEEFEKLKDLSDDDLSAKTDEFRQEIKDSVAEIEARLEEIWDTLNSDSVSGGSADEARSERLALYDEVAELEKEWQETVEDTLEDLLPEAFAVVKETCRRMIGETWDAGGTKVEWNMVPYDVQLLGGIAIHQGKIAEMKTGEGKTLVGVAPVYLNALVGRGVHLVTVNPYLAQRDAEWMGPVYKRLGLTIDVIDKYQPHSEGRRAAYRADITYGTNNEFGFDYLRDNSFVVEPNQLVQRDHHFAIIDEVDSILIDEARTPLIISGPVPQSNDARFGELNPAIAKLVQAQQKLVAGFVREAEEKLKLRDQLLEEGKNREANEAESEAGLALFRAQRGFPKNGKLRKLMQEPGVERLTQKTEYFYLQDNAKNMHIVDDALYYAVDEKLHSLEMSGKGREFTTKAAKGDDPDIFVLPDLGAEVAVYETDRDAKLKAFEGTDEERSVYEKELADELEAKKRDLYALYAERGERLHAVEQLLRAYTLYEKDVEYIVQEGKVQIVDKHTGRVLSGRRYSDGLHQAIEAKENVQVQAATQTYATVTLQNYFRKYNKLSGMTGTAETESEEFFKIYKLEVIIVPTNRPIARADLDDLIYRTRREKYNAVMEKIEEYTERGQPVLVGTTSVEVSETLSRLLKRKGIKHNVLNAKQDRAQAEAEIVAEAGRPGAVTIATNMAGRGTDIKINDEVRKAGGLAILGTERHDSRRIDLQLRGRSGRQGDPGESQFYLSLEDNLMRLFGPDRIAKVMDKLQMEEGTVITHPWVNKSIERAQKKVEQNNFGIRKRQLEYDDVLNAQREVIYDRRMHALKGKRIHGDILELTYEVIQRLVAEYYDEGDLDGLRDMLLRTLSFDFQINREDFYKAGQDGVVSKAYEAALDYYTRKRTSLAKPFLDSMQRLIQDGPEKRPERVVVDFTDGGRLLRAVAQVDDIIETEGQEINDALERGGMLSIIDEYWTKHLRGLDEVKEGIGLRAYGQRDPLIEYKMEAFKLFSEMIQEIDKAVVSFVFKAGPLVNNEQQKSRAPVPRRSRMDASRAQATHASAEPTYGVGDGASAAERDPSAKAAPVVVEKTYGRNDVVTIQNPSTGATEQIKYKFAQKKIQRGWTLVE